MTDISKIFLNEGLPGVEAQFKKEIADNDRKWFKVFVLICVIFIGFWCTKTDSSASDPLPDNSGVTQGWIDSAKAQNYKDR